MKPIFMALVGAPGSAKSTFAKLYAQVAPENSRPDSRH